MDENASPLFFLGTSSGGQTLDQGDGGGNPFASSLIELFSRRELMLANFGKELVELTKRKSRQRQNPEVPVDSFLESLRILPKSKSQSRVALVLVFADYSASGSAPSLPGAAHDAGRITAALALAGFETQANVDPKRDHLDQILKEWAGRSSAADIALIYTTGHGVEVDSTIRLLPGDFPVSLGNAALEEFALPISNLSRFMRAKKANLVFYAGCRDNPFE